jgi:hypothetical protein
MDSNEQQDKQQQPDLSFTHVEEGSGDAQLDTEPLAPTTEEPPLLLSPTQPLIKPQVSIIAEEEQPKLSNGVETEVIAEKNPDQPAEPEPTVDILVEKQPEENIEIQTETASEMVTEVEHTATKPIEKIAEKSINKPKKEANIEDKDSGGKIAQKTEPMKDPFPYRHYPTLHVCSNRLLEMRWDRTLRNKHKKKLAMVKPNVDNSSPKPYKHLQLKPKKIQMEQGISILC